MRPTSFKKKAQLIVFSAGRDGTTIVPGAKIQAITLLVLSALLMFSSHSIAAEVYRWKDEKGVVHFGDRQNAPTDSEKMITREPSGTAQAGGSPDNISTCAVYARAMVGNRNKSEWLANANKIKSTCPGTGFTCTTVNNHPEKNKCEPFIWNGSGTFFKERTINNPTEQHA